jgi:hypothetical protein
MRTCTECDRLISGKVGDAVHTTTLGTFHGDCMKIAHKRADDDEARRRRESTERRSAQAKARGFGARPQPTALETNTPRRGEGKEP